MRLALLAVTVAVVSLAASRDADAACKDRGKVIYRETITPLDDDAAAPVTLTIRATGALRRSDAADHRCLTKPQLAELKRALGRARFEVDPSSGICDAVPTMRIRHEAPGRRKQVEVERACGQALEARTQALVACVAAIDGATVDDAGLRAICRAEPMTPASCDPAAAIIYRESTWPITRGEDLKIEEPVDGWDSQLVIRKDGHVTRLTPDSATERCAGKAAITELARALKAAKFRLRKDAMTCKALPNQVVLYEAPARKKHVQTQRPCGTPVDDGTATLAACAEAIAEDRPAAERSAICRGE